jgi:hypothetical protein
MTYLIEIDGQEHEVNIPLNGSEWSYANYCDFRGAEQYWFLINRRAADHLNDDTFAYEAAQAAQAMIGQVIGEAMSSQIPMGFRGEDATTLIEHEYILSPGDELSLARLYAHLTTVAYQAKQEAEVADPLPAALRIEACGQKFTVIRESRARVLMAQPLTTSESIEVQEYRRLHALTLEGLKERHPATVAGLDYTLGLSEVALLLRGPGEIIPASPQKREQWIERRREAIKNIDLATVEQVRSFLIAAVRQRQQSGTTDSTAPVLRAVH